jgi:hypothetical protein
MTGFGYKQAWLAMRDGDPDAVLAALGLRDLGTVTWRAGGDLAYLTQDRLLLTPLLPDGRGGRWLLAAGRWLLMNSANVDVAGLSAKLGTEVQFFVTYRVLELHGWARAVGGRLVRAFRYVGERGEVTDWRGDPDAVETAIGLAAPDADVIVDENDVMRVAAGWSVDPTGLDGQPAPGPLRAAATPRT